MNPPGTMKIPKMILQQRKFEPGSLDWESGLVPLSYPLHNIQSYVRVTLYIWPEHNCTRAMTNDSVQLPCNETVVHVCTTSTDDECKLVKIIRGYTRTPETNAWNLLSAAAAEEDATEEQDHEDAEEEIINRWTDELNITYLVHVANKEIIGIIKQKELSITIRERSIYVTPHTPSTHVLRMSSECPAIHTITSNGFREREDA